MLSSSSSPSSSHNKEWHQRAADREIMRNCIEIFIVVELNVVLLAEVRWAKKRE
jgi:hypothetical protein